MSEHRDVTSMATRRRWLVPATAVGLVAAVSLFGGRLAIADNDLAPRTAAELLADLQRSRLDQLSGTVVQTAELGLPSIPGLTGAGGAAGPSGAASLSSIVSGSHTWKVWFGGEQRQRLALIGTLGESDIIRNGSDIWLWSSKDQTATHFVVPDHDAGGMPSRSTGLPSTLPNRLPSGLPTQVPTTPEEAAALALAAIDPTTRAEVGPAVVVAGRTAYELVLTPKDATTLVAQVRVAVDGERHLPLRVQVYSTAASAPAIEVGFTAIDFAAPEARQFDFTPPPGTTVTEGMSSASGDNTPPSTQGTDPSKAAVPKAASAPRVVGRGWATVVVATMPTPSTEPMLALLPQVTGAWGSGRLLEGTLFSVLLTDDGRVVAGAVGPEALYAALSGAAAPAAPQPSPAAPSTPSAG